jgi:hypothetical protein
MKALLEALPRLARDAAVGVIVPAWWGREQLKGLTTLLAERHARHLAGRAQTLQNARKPMHTDPQSLVDVWSRRNVVLDIRPKWLIFLALPRGLEPLFSP